MLLDGVAQPCVSSADRLTRAAATHSDVAEAVRPPALRLIEIIKANIKPVKPDTTGG
ncbi:hypothetical protein ACTMTF_45185 [Nonomuraea sp. ZG12]|uniref:hypothetical protein n=1 Tax=Nonomuraea sp. ZG12 TaxID=3452207 RepID=UPI003F8C774F